LPVNQKSSLSLQFNVVNILPEANIPYKLPIEIFLKNYESNERKIERRSTKSEEKPTDVARHQFELVAKSQGLIVLPEYKFKHVIYKLSDKSLSQESLIYSYNKAAMFLGLKENDTDGITMLLTPRWMMITMVTKPYMETKEGLPVYLDGFAYAGLVQLQEIEKDWPSTAAVGDTEQMSVFQAMGLQGLEIQ